MATTNDGRPGIMELARSLVRAPLERRALAEQRARFDRLELEAASMMMERTVRMVQPEDDGYVPAFGTGEGRLLDATDADTLRRQAIKAAYRSPLLSGYLKTLKRFVIGVGPTFVPDTKDENLRDEMKAWWRRFVLINQWYDMEDEFVSRTWRDGETFTRRFTQEDDGGIAYSLTAQQQRTLVSFDGFQARDLQAMRAPRGMTLLRLIDPAQIHDPTGTFREGIVTSDVDVRHVLGYVWTPPDVRTGTWVAADRMLHAKVGVDLDVLRGRSVLEILLQRDKQYEEWVRYRIALSMYRSAVVMVRKLSNLNSAAVQALRDRQAAQRDDSSNDSRVRMPRPGTTVTSGPNIDYAFLAPNLQAQDAQHDGRRLMLNMAAATGIPEYMFTGDSSNANYSSTLVSEGPAFREFKGWQDFFTPRYERVWRWVYEDAAEYGAFGKRLKRSDLDSMGVEVQWPNIEVRDEVKHAQANLTKSEGGILSKRSWATDEGLDYDAEVQKMDEEMDRAFERLGRIGGGAVPPGSGEE
jgi:hypothetical protein